MTVVGTRPQIIKAAVLERRLARMAPRPFENILIHTGQHYDAGMSECFFRELGLPQPRAELGVGSAPPADQLSDIMKALAPWIEREAPHAVLVVGDTNSTLAAALVAAHMDVPIVHVEAGERIFRRRRVPEETNRVATDHLAWLCLTASRQADLHLRREGMARRRVRFTGDLLYDLFRWATARNDTAKATLDTYGLAADGYLLATIHRPENTDDPRRLRGLLETLDRAELPVLLPVHPRVRAQLKTNPYKPRGRLMLADPVGYLDMVGLLARCRRCVSDSGGVIREAYFAGKPCVAPMETSWWTEISALGWSLEVGTDLERLARAIAEFDPPGSHRPDLFGDGDAAGKIIEATAQMIEEGSTDGPWSDPRGPATKTDVGSGSHSPGQATSAPRSRRAFALRAHGELLENIKGRGYRFACFEEAEGLLGGGERFVLMRHDIDMDLAGAWRMARLEADAGVRGTYFVMLRNSFYNPFSAEGTRLVTEILAMGHQLGLHFDCSAYDGLGASSLSEACQREARMLAEWFEDRFISQDSIRVVSFHRPSEWIVQGDLRLEPPLIHAYMRRFTQEMSYFSDSRGQWRHGHPLESKALADGRPLHILVHPIWYGDVPSDPVEALDRFVDHTLSRTRRDLAANCEVYHFVDKRDGDWEDDVCDNLGED